MDTFSKQPGETLDYDFDFTDWMPTGDAIASSVVTAESGVTLGTKISTDTVIKQFISGGTDGQKYKVTCKITTNDGRIKELELMLKIKEL